MWTGYSRKKGAGTMWKGGWRLAIYPTSQGKRCYSSLFLYPLTLLSFLASCASRGWQPPKYKSKKKFYFEQKTYLPSVLPGSQTSQHHGCASAPTTDRELNQRLHGVETSLLTEGSTRPSDTINQAGLQEPCSGCNAVLALYPT